MLSPSLVESLRQLSSPVLTLYLDTNREKQENRALRPAYLTWFKSEARRIAPALPFDEPLLFQEQAERVEAFLAHQPPRHRAIVIFAGQAAWEAVPIEIEVENELYWGAPALAQLFWLLDEHGPRGVTVVWQKGARFFLYWMGRMLELEREDFRLGASKKKEMGPVSRPGVRMSRGTDRDLYEHHKDAQYARFHRRIAERIQHWAASESLKTIFLVGLEENLACIQKELPQALRGKVVPVPEDLGWLDAAELLERLRPHMLKQERESELALVDTLLGSDRGVVTGVDGTLARLQHGNVHRLVVVKGLNGNLRQCLQCRRIDRTSDPVCPICGGQRCVVTLRQVLPELARRHQASMEVVSGEAARKLQEAGGVGAWLRELERKEYG